MTPEPHAAAPTRCRILVVDDEPMFLRLAQRILRGMSCEVQVAATGVEALRLVAERTFDLLLLDVLMPDTRGPELAQQIHATRPRLPVLFMSGHSRDTCVAHGLPPDAPFIGKPFAAQDLRALVDELLVRA